MTKTNPQGEAETDGDPVNHRPAERVRQGWRTLDHQAEQDSAAQMGGFGRWSFSDGACRARAKDGPSQSRTLILIYLSLFDYFSLKT